jgi:uncharacterized protein YcfL
MKKYVLSVIILLLLFWLVTGCASSRKNQAELRGLMLQENLQLKKNRAFYSKHNIKTKKVAYKKYKKNSRNL